MKNFVIFCLLTLLARSVEAQQAPFHRHYFVNPYVLNAAMVGSNDRMNLFLMHRSQWSGLPGAPVTSTMTFDSPIVNGTNGYGLTFFTDQTDIFRRTGGSINYAHQFNLGSNVQLRLGAGLNAFDNRVDFTKVVVLHGTDPYLFQSVQNKAVFDGSAGLNLKIQRFQFGAAVNHFGFNNLQYQDVNNLAYYRQERHMLGTMSYDFYLGSNKKIGIKPMAVFRYFDKTPYQYDGNLIFSYDERFWLAGTYSSEYGMSISAGMNIYGSITVGYSYDLVLNSMKAKTGLSSELVVGIKLGTPKEKKKEFVDTDMDGVADELDLEPDSEPGAFVNFQGITIKKKLGLEDFDTLIVKEIIYLDTNLTEAPPVVEAADPEPSNRYRASFFFDFDKSNLKANQAAKVAELAFEIRKNPKAKIVITGHADMKGSEEYNMLLGQKRAQAIAQQLIEEYGVDPNQIIAVISKGKSDPLSKTRAYVNRRVDVELVDGNMNVPTIQTPGGPQMTRMEMDTVETIILVPQPTKTEQPKEDPKAVKELLGSNAAAEGLFFTVQLGVFKNDVDRSYWKNVEPLYQMALPDGTTRYYSGQYGTKAEVDKMAEKMRAMGFNDAYSTAYYQGKRIPLDQAEELLRSKGKAVLKPGVK